MAGSTTAATWLMVKPTAMLVQAARGGIVDENALCDALAADDTLTPGAQQLKRELLACFEPA